MNFKKGNIYKSSGNNSFVYEVLYVNKEADVIQFQPIPVPGKGFEGGKWPPYERPLSGIEDCSKWCIIADFNISNMSPEDWL